MEEAVVRSFLSALEALSHALQSAEMTFLSQPTYVMPLQH